MNTDWTPVTLANFERDLVGEFAAGNIKAPVHFASGNERALIDIFKGVQPDDWVCCQWRSHLHCLLKGVPAAEVRRAVIEGRSIALCFPEHRIISSALVGGIVPIALGLAWAEKRSQPTRNIAPTMNKVWCFVGDMSAKTGIVHECLQYAQGHELPLHLVIEDNGLSVATDTRESWGIANKELEVELYEYELTFPHVGIGAWVGLK